MKFERELQAGVRTKMFKSSVEETEFRDKADFFNISREQAATHFPANHLLYRITSIFV
jgi:hypothetical protein